MINIVLPMAGRGSRFSSAGYELPKPLIEIHGIPMIKVVVDNLTPSCDHRFIFVCQKQHMELYDLENQLKSYTKNAIIITTEVVTDGQACTALLAKKYFNNDEPLMTANTDQYIDFDINNYLDVIESKKLDGMIMTMTSQDPKWSYAKTDDDNLVVKTAEKDVISNNATVGIFNFSKGRYLADSAEQMIRDNLRVNNEFYISPAYNYLIKENKRIGIYSIGEEYNGMYGLGIPEDLDFFVNHPVSRKASMRK